MYEYVHIFFIEDIFDSVYVLVGGNKLLWLWLQFKLMPLHLGDESESKFGPFCQTSLVITPEESGTFVICCYSIYKYVYIVQICTCTASIADQTVKDT